MEKKIVEDVQGHGMPLYEMKKLFSASGNYSTMSFSYIEIQPGQRVPEEGYSVHKQDEYSYFINGQLVSHNAGIDSIVGEGDATLIPRGEKHWCKNEGTEPVMIICAMIG